MLLLSEHQEYRGPTLPLSRQLRHAALGERALLWLGLVQLAIGVLATSAAFGLFVFENLTGGPQQILLLSLVRFTFLLLVGLLTCKAFSHAHATESYFRLAGSGSSSSARPGLARAALFGQLLWFSSELLLGSALLTFFPLVRGPQTDFAAVAQASRLAYRVLTVVYLAGMAGCLCFLSSLARRRRRSERHTDCASSTSSGVAILGHGKLDVSPVSEAGSFSSGASSELFYPHSGAGSPTGPLPLSQHSSAHANSHASAHGGGSSQQGTCDVILVEHEVSGSPDGRSLFVHKSLRPIRTRPEERPYVPLLKPIISNSFSFQDGSEVAAAVRAGLTVQQSGGSFGFVSSRSGSSSGMQRIPL